MIDDRPPVTRDDVLNLIGLIVFAIGFVVVLIGLTAVDPALAEAAR